MNSSTNEILKQPNWINLGLVHSNIFYMNLLTIKKLPTTFVLLIIIFFTCQKFQIKNSLDQIKILKYITYSAHKCQSLQSTTINQIFE